MNWQNLSVKQTDIWQPYTAPTVAATLMVSH